MSQPLTTYLKTLPQEISRGILTFIESFQKALKESGQSVQESKETLGIYMEHLKNQIDHPYTFSHFHAKERTPFDFYEMGRNLVRPLIDQKNSSVRGIENIREIEEKLARGDNVIFLANHQTETDPQIISLMVEPYSKKLAEDLVYIAGHRVTTDPMAVPLSRGCNLICIYSKKYLEHPPELRSEKLQHNARSLAKLEELFNQGSTALYVAPSGGRDRWDDQGNVSIASFDPQSVELFRLLAKKAKRPTHIHLLTLSTIHLLPPPRGINVELGEQRIASRGPVHLDFSKECVFSDPAPNTDKIERRKERAETLTNHIKQTYNSFFQA